jgi:hypothetical protein
MDKLLRRVNAGLAAFDIALGSTAIAAPRTGLRLLGHSEPSEDAEWLFRRCGPIWLTFAAAHLVAATRDDPHDWWALAWLRGTELATDALWSASPGFAADPRARLSLRAAGVFNLAVALGFARMAKR